MVVPAGALLMGRMTRLPGGNSRRGRNVSLPAQMLCSIWVPAGERMRTMAPGAKAPHRLRRAHRSRAVTTWLDRRPWMLIHKPRYRPDHIPVERIWSALKSHLADTPLGTMPGRVRQVQSFANATGAGCSDMPGCFANMRRWLFIVLAAGWRLLRSGPRWRVLRLTHATFLVAVAGVVFDDTGRVLLQRHRFWAAGSWGLPGGYVEPRESLEAALAREVAEESGLAIDEVRLLRVNSGFRFRVEFFLTARLAGGTPGPDPGEVLEIRFFPPDRLPEGLLREHARIVGEAVAARDQRVPSSGSSSVS